jgi:hypothetical protein
LLTNDLAFAAAIPSAVRIQPGEPLENVYSRQGAKVAKMFGVVFSTNIPLRSWRLCESIIIYIEMNTRLGAGTSLHR